MGAQDRRAGARRDADHRAVDRPRHSRSSAPPAASSASAATSTRPTSTPASRRGAPTRSRAPASPATRPGRTARTAGSTAAARSGRPRPTTRRPTPSTRASAMPDRTTTSSIVRATTSGRRACSPSIPTDGKIKWGFQYTPQDPYDYDEISEHPIINAKVNGEDRKLVVHAARNGFFYALDRTNGSFVAGKQYVDELNWTPGLDPKTGRPLNYDPNSGHPDVRAGQPRHARAFRRSAPARRTSAARTGSRPPTIRSSGCCTCPRSRAATPSRRVEQKDIEDQGGTVEGARALHRRQRQDGPAALRQRSRPSIPPTGETKANLKMDYPNYGGALATAGNLVFLGQADGTFARLRRQDLEAAVELQRRHRHQRAADHLFGERQAIRRRARGLAPERQHLRHWRPRSRTCRRPRCSTCSRCNRRCHAAPHEKRRGGTLQFSRGLPCMGRCWALHRSCGIMRRHRCRSHARSRLGSRAIRMPGAWRCALDRSQTRRRVPGRAPPSMLAYLG